MSYSIKSGHELTNIIVSDESFIDNSHHDYIIQRLSNDNKVINETHIFFQKGAVNTNDNIPGIFIEDLLQICKHRLECFQSGEYANDYNEKALESINNALMHLNNRTKNRKDKNIEGTQQK